MKSKNILKTEYEPISVSALPTRPNAPTAFGGLGYTSAELRAAFDRVPHLIIERFNALLDDISDGALCAEIKTGIREEHTLAQLFEDIKNGNLGAYLAVNGVSLLSKLLDIETRLTALERKG